MLRAGQWPAAADAAGRALELWRGEPLAGTPSAELRQRITPRLDQLRLQAFEDHAEARLRLGRHEQLVPELRELAGAHPLRERFHAQLMMALACCGRRAEALEAYQSARRTLVDQLGIEPGPELRDLHVRILAGEIGATAAAGGSATAAAPAGVAEPAPRQLPVAPRHFTGRLAELETLAALAAAAGGTVVLSAIDGMAGVGKTALAVHAAHRMADSFPDGQLFIDLHGYSPDQQPRTPADALRWLLLALGVPAKRVPQDADAAAAVYRQRLADTRTLIVLDNAADEAQVRPLLAGGDGCLVLITSRRRLKGLDDAHSVSLDVLSTKDAVVLLRAVAGRDRGMADHPLWGEIARLCGHLPLALRIAGVLLRHRPAWSLEHLAGLLRDRCHRVATLSDGDRDLAGVFDLSYASLDERQRVLFRRLGLLPGPDVDGYAAAALIDTDPDTGARLLESLVDHHLLLADTPGRYRLHDLLRAHAETLVAGDPVDERKAALDRLLDYYQYAVDQAERLVSVFHSGPARDPAGATPRPRMPTLMDATAAWAWLRAQRSNLLAAIDHPAVRADPTRLIALSAGLTTLLGTDGPWSLAAAVHAGAAAAADGLGQHTAQANALVELGRIRFMLGDYPGTAVAVRQALELFQGIGDRRGQAAALTQLGQVRALTDDLPGAVDDQRAALRLYREVSDLGGQATSRFRLAYARRMLADYPGATRDARQALDLYRELDEPTGQANALTELGQISQITGDFPGAVAALREALTLHQRVGDQNGQAAALMFLAETRTATGDRDGAVRDLEEALRLTRTLGNRQGQASVLAHLGTQRRLRGDHRAALDTLAESVALFRTIGARSGEAWALNHYAAGFKAAGDLARAEATYEEAVRLTREVHQPDDEAHALEGLGACRLSAGDSASATSRFRQALDIFERLGMAVDVDRVQGRLTELAAR
jgi:tetratricopeptide (TPR) repeat protein